MNEDEVQEFLSQLRADQEWFNNYIKGVEEVSRRLASGKPNNNVSEGDRQ